MAFVIAALLFALCVVLAVYAVRAYGRVTAVRRIQVPARVLSSQRVERERLGQVRIGKVSIGTGEAPMRRHELELEYPGPDGRPLVARKVTSHDHAIRAGGRVGPEFDGRSVWVDPQNPGDIAFSPTGDKGLVVVSGIFAGICGGGAVIALVFGLFETMFGGAP